MTDDTKPRIYVACLASYNNGVIHGAWFDLDEYGDADELMKAVREKVLLTSPHPNVEVTCPQCEGSGEPCDRCHATGKVPSAEEWAIHDYEGLEGIGEHSSFTEVMDKAEAWQEDQDMQDKHGEAWNAYKAVFSTSTTPTESHFQDLYVGAYDSEKDFAMEQAIDSETVDRDAEYFSWIDWQDAWDSTYRHSYCFEDGHVFRND